MSSSINPSRKRKRSMTSGDLVKCDKSREKYIETCAEKRRTKITRLLNLKKKRGLTKAEKQRITKLDVCGLLPIDTKWFNKILAGKKNREFRSKLKKFNRTRIGEKHKLTRYLIFWARGKTTGKTRMLIEFNGFDREHEKWKTDYH